MESFESVWDHLTMGSMLCSNSSLLIICWLHGNVYVCKKLKFLWNNIWRSPLVTLRAHLGSWTPVEKLNIRWKWENTYLSIHFYHLFEQTCCVWGWTHRGNSIASWQPVGVTVTQWDSCSFLQPQTAVVLFYHHNVYYVSSKRVYNQ